MADFTKIVLDDLDSVQELLDRGIGNCIIYVTFKSHHIKFSSTIEQDKECANLKDENIVGEYSITVHEDNGELLCNYLHKQTKELISLYCNGYEDEKQESLYVMIPENSDDLSWWLGRNIKSCKYKYY